MKIFNVDMDHITDGLKVSAALLLAWFTDFFYVAGVNTLFVSFPQVREYLLDIKDIMSFIITLMVMIITFIKLRKYLKKK